MTLVFWMGLREENGQGKAKKREEERGRKGIGGFEISAVSLLSLPYQYDCIAAL